MVFFNGNRTGDTIKLEKENCKDFVPSTEADLAEVTADFSPQEKKFMDSCWVMASKGKNYKDCMTLAPAWLHAKLKTLLELRDMVGLPIDNKLVFAHLDKGGDAVVDLKAPIKLCKEVLSSFEGAAFVSCR